MFDVRTAHANVPPCHLSVMQSTCRASACLDASALSKAGKAPRGAGSLQAMAVAAHDAACMHRSWHPPATVWCSPPRRTPGGACAGGAVGCARALAVRALTAAVGGHGEAGMFKAGAGIRSRARYFLARRPRIRRPGAAAGPPRVWFGSTEIGGARGRH